MNHSKDNRAKYFFGEKWLRIALLLIVWDIIAIHASYFLALWLRFDCRFSAISSSYLNQYYQSITIYSLVSVVIFSFFRLYRSVWRYASVDDLVRCVCASGLASLLYMFARKFYFLGMPRSYHVFGFIIQMVLVVGIRFAYRFFLAVASRFTGRAPDMERIMIIGAGSSGQMLIKDLKRTRETKATVVCLIDDDPNKQGRYIEGIRVVGGRDEILSAVEKYHVDKIFLSIPRASAEDKRDILNICKETECKLMQLPGMYQFVLGEVSVSKMREVSVEDLLGREPINADMREVFEFINDKVVLVTGGGGSIGSELCRQIAAHHPKQLIIFEVYENSAYAIQLELREKYPEMNLEVLIGSVRDSRRMFQIFEEYRPQIVYHAAAHKHVPLMEDSPCEAIKNNAIGTYKTAYAAMVHGCERFVLISTDKAVNPTNIMGASKRLCEMIIQSFDEKIKTGKADEIPQLFTHTGDENADKDGTGRVFRDIRTQFVAVRFGNVLGSNGSVIPIFKKQIEKGGPVTVTHPDIIRYFMTIPEAVSLVMLAGTYAKGGEIFVLDMGSPVKIADLARNLIRLSGYKPDVDIKIEYTGLRPGEKLYEEKLMAEEGLKKTENKLIHVGCPIPFDTDEFMKQLEGLMIAAYGNKETIVEMVEKIVSTFHPEGRKPKGMKDSVYSRLVDGEDQ
ncbi:MAG: nucleoside-diphosphate sugar epimerase/dehydratase [Lachnospiraceae bacterium]|nr:nucleoside-diphosphate sugar epimerase/dehydratase [Lachnospiraceae bacterium]